MTKRMTKRMTKIGKQDYQFVPVDPDPNFDPEHNRLVIEESIRKSKLLSERKKREHMDTVRERTQAVAEYLNNLNTGNTGSDVARYFGRRELARLRGEEIQNIIHAKIGNAAKEEIRKTAEVHAAKFRRTLQNN